jgi:hypothetical protein
MNAAPNLNLPSRQAGRVPRPLPGWLQAAFVLLLLSQVLHGPSFSGSADRGSRLRQNPPDASPPASMAYVYEPAGVTDAASAQAAFPNPGLYAHAASAQLRSVEAYDPTPGQWLARDLPPAR